MAKIPRHIMDAAGNHVPTARLLMHLKKHPDIDTSMTIYKAIKTWGWENTDKAHGLRTKWDMDSSVRDLLDVLEFQNAVKTTGSTYP